MNKMRFLALTLSLGAIVLAFPVNAYARQDDAANKRVTFDLEDSPIRKTIEAAFKQAGINNYVIDNNVVGFVTLKITEQPFENALKLIMRAASVPLTYTKENGVWIVKPRTISQPTQDQNPQNIEDPNLGVRPAAAYERINLTYLDPMDLQSVLGGIISVPFFARFGNNGMMGGGMGGMGGGMGGMGGGMGGMGGGGGMDFGD